MNKIPQELRQNIARNIRACRVRKFPGRGGARLCAEAFGVLPQQWSPWETGKRVPDESRLVRLAEFFGVTVEYLRRDNAHESSSGADWNPADAFGPRPATPSSEERGPGCPPGSSESFYRLLEWFFTRLANEGLTINLVTSTAPEAEAPRKKAEQPIEVLSEF